jgi:hypothetical protein
LRALVACAVLASGGAQAARAPATKVCNAFFEADQVFMGRITSVDRLGSSLRWHVQVERAIKGEPAASRIVESENGAGRWSAEPGETRVVFARNGVVGSWSDPVDRPSQVQNTLKGIATIGKADTATIEGEVVDVKPLGGHQMVVTGGGKRYSMYTDEEGRFEFRVPPGQYKLEIKPLAYTFAPYSRDDIEGFSLAAGQCALFRFAPTHR